jgi:molybdate transport system ATP-binding protein
VSTPAGLDARVALTRGGFELDVALQAAPGEVVALLGPNGAGKSSVLRALAGLSLLSAGHVLVAGCCWEDPTRGVRLPAPQRRTGVVFQDTLLFPHLSARDNVAYGMRHRRGLGRAQARAAAGDLLEREGLAAAADRRPAELSVGQQQRVAIVRALATEPDLMLLDEPLSALDAAASMQLRTYLRRHLAGFGGVSVLVTHDALDALVLADTVVVLDSGKVSQTGRPLDVASRPRSAHVAALMGLNLVRGDLQGHVLQAPSGARVVTANTVDSGPAFATFAPRSVTVTLSQPRGSARNAWPGRVASITPHGDIQRLQVDGILPLLADITPQALVELDLAPGSRLWCSVKAVEVDAYAA